MQLKVICTDVDVEKKKNFQCNIKARKLVTKDKLLKFKRVFLLYEKFVVCRGEIII